MTTKLTRVAALTALLLVVPGQFASGASAEPLLTVKQIMNAIITPTTATIWGAYELQTDAQWQEIENAAISVIAAANLLAGGGAGAGEQATAAETDWQTYNTQMISAAREVITAVKARDE
jgi:hypothetical protein